MIRMLFFKFQSKWSESSTSAKVLFCCGVAAAVLVIVLALSVTVQFWAPLVFLCFLVGTSLWDAAKRSNYAKRQAIMTAQAESLEQVLSFVQWFFSKSQRDRLGIQAVPLTSSMAYLTQHTKTEMSSEGFLHTVCIGLEQFNTQSFYLLWESLVEPMNEALAEYFMTIYGNYTTNSHNLKVISVTIADGSIRPEIIFKFLDRKIPCS